MKTERVRLWDHYSYSAQLQIAEPQPQYGLVQINSYRGGKLSVSHDVKRDDFIRAIEAVLNVTITPNVPDTRREQWRFIGRKRFYGYDFWEWELVANPHPLHKIGHIHRDLTA